MNDEPRQKLQQLIVDYGRSLCNDPNRCEALLKDHCGVHKREIFVLVSALKKKVTDEMLTSAVGVPLAVKVTCAKPVLVNVPEPEKVMPFTAAILIDQGPVEVTATLSVTVCCGPTAVPAV